MKQHNLGDLLGGIIIYGLAIIALLALVLPSAVVIGISFTEREFISFPPQGFTLRWYKEVFENQQLMDSIVVSGRLALLVMILCIALGMPAAFSLVRGRYPGRSLLNAFMLSPQMMPGMVIGIATLFFGSYFGFSQSEGMMALALAVFCMPFVVRMVIARLAMAEGPLEEVSSNLGATRRQTFARITMPQVMPGLMAAAAFAVIEAFDNLTVTLFTSSPRSRPLAVELYQLIKFDSSPMVAAISALEIILALIIVIALARTIGLEKLRG